MINNQSYFMTPRFHSSPIVLLFFDISHPIAICDDTDGEESGIYLHLNNPTYA